MKTRLIFIAISVLLATTIVVTSAGAITFGEPDGDRHPSVGLIVADVQGDGTLSLWCSGTLISSTVYLARKVVIDHGFKGHDYLGLLGHSIGVTGLTYPIIGRSRQWGVNMRLY